MKHTTIPFNDELLDVVDENDQVVSQKYRSEVYAKNLNFRAINVFIVNDKGQLWIPRRVATKKLFPLGLDTSIGGHVQSDETYEQAFVREVMEEVNLDITKLPYRELGYVTPYTHGVTAFMKVYEIKLNVDPDYNKDDFHEFFWLMPQELIQRIDSGEVAKSDLKPLVRIFYPH